MKLILFIGHHKVGSSALQTYLARNALALLRRGILYPAVESQGLATLLAMAMTGDDRPQGPLPVNLREAHNALAFGMLAAHDGRAMPALHEGLPPAEAMLTTILRQIEIFDPEVVILAAEVFANFSAAPALITRLAEVFEGAEIHLTATLRQVDDYLASWHGQRLRFGQKARTLPGGALSRYYNGIHFNYRQMLEPWIRHLPQASLRLRSYDQVLASGGAVQDFLTGFAIDPVAGPVSEPRVNQGVHRGLLEIARQANYALDATSAHELFQGLLRLGADLALPASAQVELYGTAARTDMATRFAPIHDWLGHLATTPFFAHADSIAQVCPHHEHAVNLEALDQIRVRHLPRFSAPVRDYLAGLTLTPNFS